jgi:hypothetical protein
MLLRVVGLVVAAMGAALVVFGISLWPDPATTDEMGIALLVVFVIVGFGVLIVGTGLFVYRQGRRRIPAD